MLLMFAPAVVIAGVLLALGRPVSDAIITALVLSCPLHMVMMIMGGHQHGHPSTSGPADAAREGASTDVRGSHLPHTH